MNPITTFENQWKPTHHHHHHHSFLKRPFLSRSARVRRFSPYEAPPHIPEHYPFRVQTQLIHIILYTFSPSLPAPTRMSHPCHHQSPHSKINMWRGALNPITTFENQYMKANPITTSENQHMKRGIEPNHHIWKSAYEEGHWTQSPHLKISIWRGTTQVNLYIIKGYMGNPITMDKADLAFTILPFENIQNRHLKKKYQSILQVIYMRYRDGKWQLN